MNKTSNVALAVLLGLVLVLGVSFLLAWVVMLLVGNASIASDGVVPSLNYWTTFWLTWAVLLLTGTGRSRK